MNKNIIIHFIWSYVSKLFAVALFRSEEGGITSNSLSSLFSSTNALPWNSLEIIGTIFLIHMQHVIVISKSTPAPINATIQMSLLATV